MTLRYLHEEWYDVGMTFIFFLLKIPKMARSATPRCCMLRIAHSAVAAVAVRSLPFMIGAGEDADMVVGGVMSCSIQRAVNGDLELTAVNGAGPLVNGEALGEGGRRTLNNGDVVAMIVGLQFAVEDIRVEAEERGGEMGAGEGALHGEAGGLQALEKALECPICMDTVLTLKDSKC